METDQSETKTEACCTEKLIDVDHVHRAANRKAEPVERRPPTAGKFAGGHSDSKSPTEMADKKKLACSVNILIALISLLIFFIAAAVLLSFFTATKPALQRRIPNALIIGAKKCGTRALLEYLRVHPDVVAPGPEQHFFDRNFHRGLEWYRLKMPRSRDNQLVIEKTPNYLIDQAVPNRVKEVNPKMKLLVILRDPVERAVSDYTQAVSKGQRRKSFENVTISDEFPSSVNEDSPLIRIGLYADHLEHWLKYFPRKQFLVVSGEKLISDPAKVMLKVDRFLNLKPLKRTFEMNEEKGFYCIKQTNNQKRPLKCLRETKGRKHVPISAKVNQTLSRFYAEKNRKLFKVIQEHFQWPSSIVI